LGSGRRDRRPSRIDDTKPTHIGAGTRAHYTNDEEHAYEVERPFLFNGIPVDLAERPDLASRTIKLNLVPIPPKKRRGPAELKEEFERVWPGIFGALLDGLQGAMAGWREINVADAGFEPARMKDFESSSPRRVAAQWASRNGSSLAPTPPIARAQWWRPLKAVRWAARWWRS
jgi:hypothetical protein